MSRVHVDAGQVRGNIAAFHARARVPVRAHVKGHRTLEIARMQREAGARGIAVTRAALARRYLAAGCEDIVVAWPWRDPEVLAAFVALAPDCALSVHVEDVETVGVLGRLARRHGVSVGVRLPVEEGTDVHALARAVDATPGLTLDGIVGYLDLRSPEEAAHCSASARGLALGLVGTAERLRADGHACPVVALGGTPCVDAAVPGVTELGAGAYALGDAGLVALGVYAPEDIAVSVDPTGAGLMDDGGQPWQPRPWTRRPDGRLVPTHICPLLRRVPELHTGTGGTWRVLPQENPR
ncbi:alanine racemase [Streptomyces sp. NPDC054796]